MFVGVMAAEHKKHYVFLPGFAPSGWASIAADEKTTHDFAHPSSMSRSAIPRGSRPFRTLLI